MLKKAYDIEPGDLVTGFLSQRSGVIFYTQFIGLSPVIITYCSIIETTTNFIIINAVEGRYCLVPEISYQVLDAK